jgi:hypothetical protein
MILYQILLFLHVTAAVTMFAAWGADGVVLSQLRRAATLEAVRSAAAQRARWGRLAPVSMLATLGTGIWMMGLSWGPQAWLMTAVVGLVAIIIAGVGPERREAVRLAAILAGRAGDARGGAGAGGTGTPPGVSADRDAGVDMSAVRRSSGALAGWLSLRVALGVGIVALMTAKPAALPAVQILGAALAIGAVAAGLFRRASMSGSAETALY